MKLKSNYKKIFLILAVILVSAIVLNTAYAEITINDQGGVGKSEGGFSNFGSGFAKVITYIGEMAASGVFATITALINITGIAMFLVLQITFSAITSTVLEIPMPDSIVFNRFAFFDPNFISPSTNSIVGGLQDIIGNIFYSFQAIAISVFILSAMISGLKMALSSIAAKKAIYKEAALRWVTGFIILMSLRIIIEGIFYINENVVALLYKSASSTPIPVYITDAIPIFGKLLTDIFKAVSSIWGGNGTPIEIDGYIGIVLANLTKSIGGDIIASLVGIIILGQTLTIIGSYIKRLFMCIVLGVISPLVVAVDTINSSMGKQQSNILKNWFRNFTLTVFTQSIHAVYMVVVLQMISKLYAKSGFNGFSSGQIGIITIMLTTGLVKLEKMFKSVFGIGDSFAGDLKDGAHGMIKAMGAVRGLKEGLSAVADNGKKVANARRMKSNAAGSISKTYYEKAKSAKESGNMDQYREFMKEAAKYRKEEKEYLGRNADVRGKNGNSSDFVQNSINNHMASAKVSGTSGTPMSLEDQKRAYNEAKAYEKSALLATLMGPANLIGSMAFSYGMKPEFDETLFKGGYLAKAMDAGTERLGYIAGGGKVGYSHDVSMGQRKGPDGKTEKIVLPPTEKQVVEKTVISNFKNPKLYVNPAEVTKEISKQMKQVGEVFGDTMKRKIKEIDRNIDNH